MQFYCKYLTNIYIRYKSSKCNKQLLLSPNSIQLYDGKDDTKDCNVKITNLINNKKVSIIFENDNACLYVFFNNKNLAKYFEIKMKGVYNLQDLKSLIKFVEQVLHNSHKSQYKKRYTEPLINEVLKKILLKKYEKVMKKNWYPYSLSNEISSKKNEGSKEENKKMKSFKFKNQDLFLEIGTYAYNNYLAVMCNTADEPYGVITINLPGMYLESKDEAFIDPINKDCGLLQTLIDEGIIKKVIKKNVQYNMGKYDLVKFDMDKLKEYDPKGYAKYLKDINYDEDISIKPSI